MAFSEKKKQSFTEQDTADKLILPILANEYGFPSPDSMDYQAQHTLPAGLGKSGRYDGLYLNGGYPYVVLEAKKYSHDLNDKDLLQARSYAVSEFFDKPVPFIVLSNGKDFSFYKKNKEYDPSDGKSSYTKIPLTNWDTIIAEKPGQVRVLITSEQLIKTLREIKSWVYRDIKALFYDSESNKLQLEKSSEFSPYLKKIVSDRNLFINPEKAENKQIEYAIETIALHFTIKVLFIKIIEDLSSGSDTPRIIHTFFPRKEFNIIGGVFGYKVLNALNPKIKNKTLRIYLKSKKFYSDLGQDLAQITYQDLFRYGFNVHMTNYGNILRADNYDKFLPNEKTLEDIREQLIGIDIRGAILYAYEDSKSNVLGDIYEKLIDEELRNSIGAIYTPDETVKFMVELGKSFLGRYRGNKILETACGSGHFYREIYRAYVDEVIDDSSKNDQPANYHQAHNEALEHVLGRDKDPFAVQLTLLGVFLEQLKDNVKANSLKDKIFKKLWKANFYIDCQNSLDPITIEPGKYLDIFYSLDFESPKKLVESCTKALDPSLIIGNPPYGVKVVKGDHYDQEYDLQSKDSYGYFIVNAIKRLPKGKRVIFIVSSSFLTIKSHFKLRNFILNSTKIIRLIKLHRATFPGIDIFPVIIELEKCSDESERCENVYQFYDLWQLHPEKNKNKLKEVYSWILNDINAQKKWTYDSNEIARYKVRQGNINIFSHYPIFDGMPSLFQFLNDSKKTPKKKIELKNQITGKKDFFSSRLINNISILKLGEISEVKTGLQVPSTKEFYRITPGKKGGATKGGYSDVELNLIVSKSKVEKLTKEEKENGIEVNDLSSDQYFVPLDKAGISDIEGKVLNQYYEPIVYYVDWSKQSLKKYKTDKKAVFRNPDFYFKKGISFSDTGIYSPMFRLSNGGVFDQKASCIFCDYFSPNFLLGILCSKLVKYMVKIFINHSVSATADSMKEIPIAIPTASETKIIEKLVSKIISSREKDSNYDYSKEQTILDQQIYMLYGLSEEQIQEVEFWYARRYPKLKRDKEEGSVEK